VNAHEITYVHIMCEGHEIVDADGCMAETFHPGPVGLSTLDYDGLRAMMDIFPELSEGSTPFPLARPELKRREINAIRIRASDVARQARTRHRVP
jgi:hypothetical protein